MAWSENRVVVAALLLGPAGLVAVWLIGWRQPGLVWPAASTLWVALVVAPLLEETVFRGGLQEWLLQRGVPWSNLLTSLAFGVAHVLIGRTAVGLLVIAPSLVLGWVYARHRRLGPVILLHAGYNALWLFFSHS